MHRSLFSPVLAAALLSACVPDPIDASQFEPGSVEAQAFHVAGHSDTGFCVPPIADAGGTYLGTPGQPIPMDDSGSGPSIFVYEWDCGNDGTFEHLFTSPNMASCIFLFPGTYTVVHRVTNECGTDVAQTSVVVDNPQLQVVADTLMQTVDEGVNNTYSVTVEPPSSSLVYTWNFGDGTPPINTSSDTLTHTYADGFASHRIQVDIFEPIGERGASASGTTDVLNVDPVVQSENLTQTTTEGNTVNFSIVATDVPADQPLDFFIDFGDGSAPLALTADTTATFSHVYADGPATHNLTVLIVDEPIPAVTPGNTVGTDLTTTVTGPGLNQPGIVLNSIPVAGTITVLNAPPVGSHTFPNLNENEQGTFVFSATDPSGGDRPFTFTVDYGDGSPAVSSGPISGSFTNLHTYADDGTYDVTVTVTDDDPTNNSSTTVTPTTVTNLDPTGLNVAIPGFVGEGFNQSYTAIAADVPADASLTYSFDFGDGTPIQTTTTTGTASVSHAYGNNGTYPLTVTVTDGDGGSAQSTLQVMVAEVAPSINTEFLDVTGTEGQPVMMTVDATGVDQPFTYMWDFGDGTSTTVVGSGAVTHTWPDDGGYSISITVTDSANSTSGTSGFANISNALPVITSDTLTQTTIEGSTVVFTIEATDVAADQPLTFDINFGDGTTDTVDANTTATFSHTYANGPATFTTTIQVHDDGPTPATASGTLTVHNAPPTGSHTVPTLFEGQQGTFVFNATDPGNDTPYTYDVDYGDGSTTTLVSAGSITDSHSYPDDGAYTVTVTVADSDGASSTSTLTATVSNVAPANLNVSMPSIIREGSNRSYTAIAADVPADSPLSYTFDFGDGSPPVLTTAVNNATVSHTYGDDGLYTLTVTVDDGDGGTASTTREVTVQETPPFINTESVGVNGAEGEALVLTVDASGVDMPFTYNWTFGDGTSATVNGSGSVTHTWQDDDLNYPVQVQVVDSDGSISTVNSRARITNVDPVITGFSASSPTQEGVPFQLTLTATDVAGDTPLSYTVDFGGGNTTTGTFTGSTTIPATYNTLGAQTIQVTVDDGDGGSDTASVGVDITDVPPTHAAVTGPAEIDEGTQATFTATATAGPGDTLTYVFDFGDGSMANGVDTTAGVQASHTYADGGANHVVTVTVTDDDGSTATATTPIQVNNVAPVISNFSHLGPVLEGSATSFSASATDVLADALITWDINFGDGSSDTQTVAGTAIFSHTYADGDASFTATITATDKDGGIDSSSDAVDVLNVPPAFGNLQPPAPGVEGTEVVLTLPATDPGDDTLTYLVNWGDGTDSITYIGTVRYTYGDDATYEVQVTVSDEDGGSDSTTVQVPINNAPPAVDAGADQSGTVGIGVTLTGSFTDPGFLDTHTIAWDFGDGSTASGALSSTHTYSGAGLYTAVLTVIDDDGGSSSDTVMVDVVQAVFACELQITEVMADPNGVDEQAEWIEVYNPGADDIDMRGLTLASLSGTHTVQDSFIVPAGSYAILCPPAEAHELSCDYTYDAVTLPNGPGGIALTAGLSVISAVTWTDTVEGESYAADCITCSSETGETVGHSDLPNDPSYGAGGNGTPGYGSDDLDLDGTSACVDDCDDNDPDNYLGNPEVCDGQDNNCDTSVDEGFDADGDGVADCFDICPDGDDLADADGDGIPNKCDACPIDGDPGDDDGDTVCNSEDVCPGADDTLDSDRDGVPNACDVCPFDNPNDTDGDGVCDSVDACPGFDDTIDTDEDGIPNACDDCPDDADPGSDTDGDGVCNSVDACPGFDDNLDGDGDGVADGCDACPFSNPDDSDLDNVCDDIDICLAGDDAIDTDQDGIPNACDACPIDGNPGDDDGDGICNSVESCEGGVDTDDRDHDGVCDFLDPCPDDNPDDTDGDGVCDSEDICMLGPDGMDDDADGVPDACDVCPDDIHDDSDGDGSCDSVDLCDGFDDNIDTDSDGQPDACDPCPTDATDDSDGDGVCDSEDSCPDGNDALDADMDGVPDFCDVCPDDFDDDSDGDGSCDSVDTCPDGDDFTDTDEDGMPDDCDACPIDNPNDSDNDGVCDSADLCPNADDTIDFDLDGVPDACDDCPMDAPDDDLDGDGVCNTDDVCHGFDDGIDTDSDGVADGCDECPDDFFDLCHQVVETGDTGDTDTDVPDPTGDTGLPPTGDTGEADTDTDADTDSDADTDADTDSDADADADTDADSDTDADADTDADSDTDSDADTDLQIDTDDNFGFQDADGDGYPQRIDCDDGNADIHPEAEEVIDDGIDQDCDGGDKTTCGCATPSSSGPGFLLLGLAAVLYRRRR